jgi:hypothetical protein
LFEGSSGLLPATKQFDELFNVSAFPWCFRARAIVVSNSWSGKVCLFHVVASLLAFRWAGGSVFYVAKVAVRNFNCPNCAAHYEVIWGRTRPQKKVGGDDGCMVLAGSPLKASGMEIIVTARKL